MCPYELGRRSVAGPAEKLSLEVTAFCVLATHIMYSI